MSVAEAVRPLKLVEPQPEQISKIGFVAVEPIFVDESTETKAYSQNVRERQRQMLEELRMQGKRG